MLEQKVSNLYTRYRAKGLKRTLPQLEPQMDGNSLRENFRGDGFR